MFEPGERFSWWDPFAPLYYKYFPDFNLPHVVGAPLPDMKRRRVSADPPGTALVPYNPPNVNDPVDYPYDHYGDDTFGAEWKDDPADDQNNNMYGPSTWPNYIKGIHGNPPEHLAHRARFRRRKRKYSRKLPKKWVSSVINLAKHADSSDQSNSVTDVTFAQHSSETNESKLFELMTIDTVPDIDARFTAFNWEGWVQSEAAGDAVVLGEYTVDFSVVDNVALQTAFSKKTAQLKNNYSTPAHLEVWVLVARLNSETGEDALTQISDNVGDIETVTGVSGGPDTYDELMFLRPTRIYSFNQYWKVLKYKKYRINPGESVYLQLSNGPFSYNPDSYDEDGNLKNLGGITKSILCRLKGGLGHDSGGSGSAGIAPAALDVMITEKYKIYAPKTQSQKQFHTEDGTYATITGNIVMDTEQDHGNDETHG
jgi:hypothetical protein